MSSTPPVDTTVGGRHLPPPIYHLAGVAALRDGDHTHNAWHARVVHESLPAYSIPMIVKAVHSDVTMAVEVACGLAARQLHLNVPQPGLVVADRDDLPELDDDIPGDRLLLVGSHYQRPDALFAEAMSNDAAAEELIWQKVCESPVAKQGAAFDELIANPDRHCENILFDGTTWWLFDHDQALAPTASYAAQHEDTEARQQAIAHSAEVNLLAEQLARRYANQYMAIIEQSRRMDSGARRLRALATYARAWSHPDKRLNDTLQLIGVVLGLISLRLPALADKITHRMQPGTSPPSLWTSPAPRT